MNYQLDVTALATLVSSKRAGRGLHEVAAEIGGVSSTWLSRVEHKEPPTLATLLHLCNWLEIPPGQFLYDANFPVPASTSEALFPHLEVVKPKLETLEESYHRLVAEATADLEKMFYS